MRNNFWEKLWIYGMYCYGTGAGVLLIERCALFGLSLVDNRFHCMSTKLCCCYGYVWTVAKVCCLAGAKQYFRCVKYFILGAVLTCHMTYLPLCWHCDTIVSGERITSLESLERYLQVEEEHERWVSQGWYQCLAGVISWLHCFWFLDIEVLPRDSPELALLQAQSLWHASGSARRKYRVATRQVPTSSIYRYCKM